MALTTGDKAWIKNLFLEGVQKAIDHHQEQCLNGVRKEMKMRAWQLLALMAGAGSVAGTLVKVLGG